MKAFSALTFAFFALLFTGSTQAEHFGAPIKAGKPISLSEGIAASEKSKDESLLIEAEVTSVCQAKGCWLGLTDPAGEVRVTFKDYGFFVPFSIVGKTVWVEGVMDKKTLSLADSKHYVEDAGGDPDSVTEPRTEYTMVASGVAVKD